MGNLNNTVYDTKSQTLEELRDNIEHAIRDSPLAIIQKVVTLFDVILGVYYGFRWPF